MSLIHRSFTTRFIALIALYVASLPNATVCSAGTIQKIALEVLQTVPRDARVFTQGFVIDGDTFFVSSGLYNQSFIQRYSRATPNNRTNLDIPRQFFAEGLTLFNDSLYLMTWRGETAWRFDKNSFEVLDTYRYSGEGWGLTQDGKSLISSDGSHILTFRDPRTFAPIKSLSVTRNGRKLKDINELEYHNGIVWANQWRTAMIYGIDSDSGNVIAELDCSSLLSAEGFKNLGDSNRTQNVLNGIAYDAHLNAFWITGKRWRHRYLVKLALSPTKTDS